MIDKYIKFAPYLLGLGFVVALGLFLSGHHLVYYEAKTLCTVESCPTERWRFSLPFIFALVAFVDGIALMLFGQARKKGLIGNPPTTHAPQENTYNPETGTYNPSAAGHYDPNNPESYNPNTPNK